MNIFKKLFSSIKNKEAKIIELSSSVKQSLKDSSTTKSIFLTGWEVEFNGDEQCHAYLSTHRTIEINAKNVYSGIELIFQDNKLVSAYDYEEGTRQVRELNDTEIGLAYKEYRIHPILKFSENRNGKHQLGGKKPSNIQFPENDCAVPFQYLGYISSSDENFKWLPSTIHLMCPIYLNIGMVFLDYSNPLKPVIINKEEVDSYDTSYSDLSQQTIIEFNSRKFDLVPWDNFEPPLHSGIPSFIQYPSIPKCPKTGNIMRFLCQINEGVDASYTNVEPEKESYRNYFEKLNFWGDGDLFVFIEPKEKTVCYFIQNT